VDFPNAPHFALFDIRNIPLHIYTLFMHYSQGWVQNGYRFMLDYLPFLAILTVMGFDDNQSQKARAVR
jgi:hypothetical protein